MTDVIRWHSDGWNVGVSAPDQWAGYEESLPDLPTDDEIDAVARDRCVSDGMLACAGDIPRGRARGLDE